MKIKQLTLLLVLFSYTTILISQTNSRYVSGEIMVQLKSKTDLPILLQSYKLTKEHTVSERFNIYLLKFDDKRTTNSAIISTLITNKSVINVQNNHYISLRESTETLPNDSLFNDQWSLLNTGQGSGTPGADIDATLAWDITTGGVTALGDTIVVAIIDGGADLNHEDLDFWKNKNEIPNNNIDDDGNGYVDDYDGWNAYTHSGVIPMHLHGTHVAGIAGAIGNNNIGISGVNWNVKTLPVVGDSKYESIVVEALSYIYVVREQYDQTNGAEGAFVVADNASFGVDGGDPDDFPIWEAMYDSLGQLGILSMGATANHNWNIDSVGDVPTAFETDFMISVTNTTKRDEKYTNAGYGLTTIDLSAPGTLIKSLGLNNSYTYKSGTSMATPHVCGAAALLLSAADSAFMIEYKNNPAQGALLLKGYLLDGVEQLEDLQGVTVTGGRLNIFNSINLMLDVPLTTNIDYSFQDLILNTSFLDTLIITNTGSDTLNYSLTISDKPNWLTLMQNQGALASGESDYIGLYFNSNGMDTGYYNCVINIEIENVDVKLIPVQMYVYDNVGILNIVDISPIKVFPNPTSSLVRFNFNVSTAGNASIEIYNQYGNIVYTDNKNITNNNGQFTWNKSNQLTGVYYYRLIFNNKLISSGKIVRM